MSQTDGDLTENTFEDTLGYGDTLAGLICHYDGEYLTGLTAKYQTRRGEKYEKVHRGSESGSRSDNSRDLEVSLTGGQYVAGVSGYRTEAPARITGLEITMNTGAKLRVGGSPCYNFHVDIPRLCTIQSFSGAITDGKLSRIDGIVKPVAMRHTVRLGLDSDGKQCVEESNNTETVSHRFVSAAIDWVAVGANGMRVEEVEVG